MDTASIITGDDIMCYCICATSLQDFNTHAIAKGIFAIAFHPNIITFDGNMMGKFTGNFIIPANADTCLVI